MPHRQVVFTIPKRLRVFFRYDRKLLGELAGCAWRALKLYFEAYFDGEAFRTPVTCLFFRDLERFEREEYQVVARTGIEPVLPA